MYTRLSSQIATDRISELHREAERMRLGKVERARSPRGARRPGRAALALLRRRAARA